MNKNDDGYIIEFVTLGKYLKVTAIDQVTGREATVMGPAGSSKRDMTRLAVRKLEYMMKKDD